MVHIIEVGYVELICTHYFDLAIISNSALAARVNLDKILHFFTSKLYSLKAPTGALIMFNGCQIPFPDSPSCSAPNTT